MKVILLPIIVLLSVNCLATKKLFKSKNNLKHTYKEYVDLYGKNDTSRAIIELFFDKREMNAAAKMSFMPVSLAVTVVAPPIGIGLATVSAPLFISGVITRKRYNHKKLKQVLDAYNEGGELSKRIKRKVKQILIAEKEYREEDQTALRKHALRPVELIESEPNTILVVK
ncbi:MAG: hypothetical protein ACPGSO_06895 [Vicingaceae bacterium]